MMEILVVISMAGILTLGAGVLLANGQKSWNRSISRVYGDSAVDGFVVQKAFDTVCRKASTRKYVLSEDADSLELYYWDGSSSATTPENYARFYKADDEVFVVHGKTLDGTWQPDESTSTTGIKLASDVESLKFTIQGTSVQMFLSYTDEDLMPVVCSSVRHND